MAFGIPGSNGNTDNNQFLGRIQYDARVGTWKIVKRVQASDGGWRSEESSPLTSVSFLMDMGGLEVGYIKIATPPVFILVPYGAEYPRQPDEMTTDAQGNQKKAYLPGCRVKVYNPALFDDEEPYYFSVNSQTALQPMDDLYHVEFLRAPEAAQGLIPWVECKKTEVVQFKNKKTGMTTKFYAPVFTIETWKQRDEFVFGERTVPAPRASATQPTPASAAPTTGATNGGDRRPEPQGMPENW